MNKAELADRLAARTGLGKSVAKEAVDGVFRGHRRRACQWRGSTDRGIRGLRHQKPAGPYRTPPEDRKCGFDIGVDIAHIQGR